MRRVPARKEKKEGTPAGARPSSHHPPPPRRTMPDAPAQVLPHVTRGGICLQAALALRQLNAAPAELRPPPRQAPSPLAATALAPPAELRRPRPVLALRRAGGERAMPAPSLGDTMRPFRRAGRDGRGTCRAAAVGARGRSAGARSPVVVLRVVVRL